MGGVRVRRRAAPSLGTHGLRPHRRPHSGFLYGVVNHTGHIVFSTYDRGAAVRKASAVHGAVVDMHVCRDFRRLPDVGVPDVPNAGMIRTAVCRCGRSIWWSEIASSGFAAWVHLVGGSPICWDGLDSIPTGQVRP